VQSTSEITPHSSYGTDVCDPDAVPNENMVQLNLDDNMKSFWGPLSSDDVFFSSSVQSWYNTNVNHVFFPCLVQPSYNTDVDQDLDDIMESFQDLTSSSYFDSTPPRSVTEARRRLQPREHKQLSEMTKQQLAAHRCHLSRLKKKQKFQDMEQQLAELKQENEVLRRRLHQLEQSRGKVGDVDRQPGPRRCWAVVC